MPLIMGIIICVAVLVGCGWKIRRDSRPTPLPQRDIDAELYALDPEFAVELGYEPPKPQNHSFGAYVIPRAGEVLMLEGDQFARYAEVDRERQETERRLGYHTTRNLSMMQGNAAFAQLYRLQQQQAQAMSTRSGTFGAITGNALGSIFGSRIGF